MDVPQGDFLPPDKSEEGLVEIVPGAAVFAGALQGLADMRILAGGGTEIGYVFEVVRGQSQTVRVPATARDVGSEVLVTNIGHQAHNFALLDLGATVCRYINPECGRCPLSSICGANQGPQTDAQRLHSDVCDDQNEKEAHTRRTGKAGRSLKAYHCQC